MIAGVPAWAIVVLLASLAAWGLLFAGLTTATRPRPVRPGPAGLELGGDEPPAVVNLLANGWQMTEDALAATLLDLSARDMIDLVQQGPEAERTVCVIREPAAPHLLPYERRVYDRVAGLAQGGVVPVQALERGTSSQAQKWWRGFRHEVIVDAQARGLSRNRWGAGIKTVFGFASLLPATAVGIVVFEASDEGGGVFGTAFFSWLLLAGFAASRNRQRDTPAGREAAARWKGLREHLGRNEVFDTLPPAAVAIWDRYLGYGAALGVAGTASRVLTFGAQSERLAWSAYGGTWHRVRIRYPGNRAAEGRHPAASAFVGLLVGAGAFYALRGLLTLRRRFDTDETLGLGISSTFSDWLDTGWTRLVLLVLVGVAVVLLVWAAWTIVRAVLDLGARNTFEAEVLRVRRIADDEGTIKEYAVALDDGRSEKVRAYAILPKRMPSLDERDVVSVTAGRWLRYVFAITVVRRGTVLSIDDGPDDVDSQVVTQPSPVASGPLFSVAEVSAAHGRPVNPRAETPAMFGQHFTEYAAVGGKERVLVHTSAGGLTAAAAGLARRKGGRDVDIRNGSVAIRLGEALVIVHVRNADPATTDAALRRFADLALRNAAAR